MLQQNNQPVEFSAFFTKNKVGQSGLSVTCDVYAPPYYGNVQKLESDVVAVEVGGGIYSHQYLNSDTQAEGAYHCVFKANDATVDAPEVRDVCIVGYQWVQNVNTSTQSILNQVQQLPANVGAGVWNVMPNPPSYQNVGSFGNLLYVLANAPAGGGSDPLTAIVPASYATDTAGYALGQILMASAIGLVSTGPVDPTTGNATIRRGDAYKAAENRALTWTFKGLPGGLNFTGATTWLSFGRGATVVRKEATSAIYDGANRTLTATFELSGTDTVLTPGDYKADIETDFADGDPVTWGGTYTLTVVEDVR